MLVGTNHHRHRIPGVDSRSLLLDPGDRGRGLLESTGTDEKPRRFGSKVDEDDERDRPDPLDSEWDAVGQLVASVRHGFKYTGSEELADDPAQVDIGLPTGQRSGRPACSLVAYSEVTTESNVSDFTGIRHHTSLESAPVFSVSTDYDGFVEKKKKTPTKPSHKGDNRWRA